MFLNQLFAKSRGRENTIVGVRVWNAARSKQGTVDRLAQGPKGTLATINWDGGGITEWEVFDLTTLHVVGTSEESKTSYDSDVREFEFEDDGNGSKALYLRREEARQKARAPTVRLNYG